MLTNNFWETITPSVLIQKSTGYLLVPALGTLNFTSYGVPTLVAKFNYNCPNNFCLQPVPPLSQIGLCVNLAIRYTDPLTGKVVRYKLWNTAPDAMNDIPAPLYTGQPILGSACSIEVWSQYNLGTLSILGDIKFNVSVKKSLQSLTDPATFQLASYQQCTQLFNTNGIVAAPAQTTIALNFDPNQGITTTPSKVSQWIDQVSGITLAQGTDADRPAYTAWGDGVNYYLDFTPSTCLLTSAGIGPAIQHYFALINIQLLTLAYLQNHITFNLGNDQLQSNVLRVGTLIQATSGTSGVISTSSLLYRQQWLIVEVQAKTGTIGVYQLNGGVQLAFSVTPSAGRVADAISNMFLGPTSALYDANMYLASIIGYSDTLSATNRLMTLQYLLNRYGTAFNLPIQFASCLTQ